MAAMTAMANPHARAPLREFGAPLADAAVAVVHLHGRELGAASAIELAARIAAPGVAHVIPEAADRTWYPASFLAPIASNQPRLDDARARVDELVRDLGAAGFAPARIVVLGFSQGACLALDFLYRTPGACGAAIAFTGGLIGPPETRWTIEDVALAGVPIVLTTSDVDSWVPLARVEESAAAFRARGARVELEVLVGRAHLVDDREIAAARALLADRVALVDRLAR